MTKYLVSSDEINTLSGDDKQHFLNHDARRRDKSLGDLTGLTGFGFHLVTVEAGLESTEFHVHQFEDECVYVLSGKADVTVGDETFSISSGDFVGYRAGGLAHTMINTGKEPLVCIVVGSRLAHDVVDYPRQHKRLYRNNGMPRGLVDIDDIKLP